MLRRFNVAPRVVAASSSVAAAAPTAATRSHYNWFIWGNPTRQPQLSAEERAKVQVDESKFPAEFKDYDEADPYKNMPLWIEGMSTWSYYFLGVEIAFIYTFYDMVFPKSI